MRAKLYDMMRVASPYWLRRWIKNSAWFTPVSKAVFGTSVYSESYFKDIERIEGESVEHIAEWIVANLRPRRAVDIGCGPGHLMLSLQKRGVEVFGVDIAEAALDRCRQNGVRAEAFDLTSPTARVPGAPYDLAISCEVAEHLDAAHAGQFLTQLTACAKTVYLTAAEQDPSIGPGLHHVNEQPNSYWIALMKERGYALDEAATASARQALTARNVVSYLAKPMIFRA